MYLGWHLAQHHELCNATMPLFRYEIEDGLVVPVLHHDVKINSSVTWLSETASALQGEMRTVRGVNLSGQTIWKYLWVANLISRCQAVWILPSQRHRRLRLQWCRCHMCCDRKQWSQVDFLDESRINLRFNDDRSHVYRLHVGRFSYANVNVHDR